MLKELFFRRKLHYFIFFIIFWLFLIKLYDGTLRTYDECYYAEQAREILITKDPLTMHFGLDKNFENDPVYLWSMAAAFKLFGVNEIAARMPSALYGGMTVVTTFLIGRLLYGYLYGITAALILGTTFEFIRFSRYAHLDVCLTFFITLAIYFFIRYETNRIKSKDKTDCKSSGAALSLNSGWNDIIMMALAGGMAILSKNILGSFFVISIICYYIINLDFKGIFNRKIICGFLMTGLLPGIWYIYQYLTNGMEFFKVHFGYIIFKRALNNAVELTPVYQYFKIIALTYLPWLLFLMPGCFLIIKNLFWKNPAISEMRLKYSNRLAFLILLYPAVFLTIMSSSQAKKGWYIMSVYPFFALISALFIADYIFSKKLKKLLAFNGYIAGFIVFAIFIISLFPVKVYKNDNLIFKNEFKNFADSRPELKYKKDTIIPVDTDSDPFDYKLPMMFYSQLYPDVPVKSSGMDIKKFSDKTKYYLCETQKFDKMCKDFNFNNGSLEIFVKTSDYILWNLK